MLIIRLPGLGWGRFGRLPFCFSSWVKQFSGPGTRAFPALGCKREHARLRKQDLSCSWRPMLARAFAPARLHLLLAASASARVCASKSSPALGGQCEHARLHQQDFACSWLQARARAFAQKGTLVQFLVDTCTSLVLCPESSV